MKSITLSKFYGIKWIQMNYGIDKLPNKIVIVNDRWRNPRTLIINLLGTTLPPMQTEILIHDCSIALADSPK